MNTDYGEAWYWDKRYAQDPSVPFDWYQKYHSLSPLLNLYVPRHHRVLVVGCGNSAFSEGMVNDGYKDIYNIDVSSVAIQWMQKKYASLPQLKYMQMDVRDMNAFEAGSFDAIVDKGTLDSILCGHNSRENANKMLKEIWRVLKNKGIYILITYGAPNYRVPLLRNSCSWTIKLHAIAVKHECTEKADENGGLLCSLQTVRENKGYNFDFSSFLTTNILFAQTHDVSCIKMLNDTQKSVIVLVLRDKNLSEETSKKRAWNVSSPIPLDDNGVAMEAALGKNPEVHFIYVCMKEQEMAFER